MTKMVVFLGNPGNQYSKTRHNAGTVVCDSFCFSDSWQTKFHGLFQKDFTCIWLKPQTFMNESGLSIREASDFFSVKPENILVVHDDLELKFGDVRFQTGGGLGGHNGLRSVKQCLGTDVFARVRIGIGRPEKQDVASYVLSRFSEAEEKMLPSITEKARELIMQFVRENK